MASTSGSTQARQAAVCCTVFADYGMTASTGHAWLRASAVPHLPISLRPGG